VFLGLRIDFLGWVFFFFAGVGRSLVVGGGRRRTADGGVWTWEPAAAGVVDLVFC
jgi:hypothetical protein